MTPHFVFCLNRRRLNVGKHVKSLLRSSPRPARPRGLRIEPLEERHLLDAHLPAPVDLRDVVINEIMYHPAAPLVEPAAAGNAEPIGLEFIELLNNDSVTVDVGGWRVNRGVSFTIPPQTMLDPRDYLVIAADVDAFEQRYPAVTRVIGGWQGALNNTTERIRLVDGLGNTIDEVRYADEGEWAIRRLEQDPVDRSFTGWKWFAPHDGDGFSLSLRNADLPNDVGQNWEASIQIGGTPGAANAGVVTANVAPLILDLEHSPAIPAAGEPVTVSVRIVDELPAAQLSVTVHHRLSGQPAFTPTQMIDGGDGLFHAQLPGRPDGSIVEFFVEADDGRVEPSRWPRPSPFGAELTNALYQVDEGAVLDFDEPWPLEQPIFRIVLSQQGRIDLTALENANGRNSKINAEVHATLIASSPNRGVEASNGDVVEITPGVLTDLSLGIFGDAEASVVFPEELFEGGENIDAIHELANGNLVFSTSSNATLVGSDLLFGNGDLVQYNPITGEVSLFFSELLFDGGNEDINAVYIDESNGSVYLSTDGDASIDGFSFFNGDVIKITPDVLNTDFALGQLGDAVVTRIFSEDLFDSGANIDAIAVLANGNLALSTTGNEILAGRAFGPADVIEYDPGDAVRDPLASVLFSAATFAGDNEDINALLINADGSLAISTDGNAQLGTNPRIRYNVGIRIRGNGTRDDNPKNYRIEIPTDRMFQGSDSLNLNSQYSHAALLGSELFREADMVREKIRAVQLRINGVSPAGSGSTAANHVNYGSYVQIEAITGRWAEDHISPDPEGNYYRQVGEANFQNAAWTVNDYKASLDYNKGTNSSGDDWNDLVSLAQAFNISPQEGTYLDEISQVVNVNQWLRHMAVQALLANDEGGIGTMRGDDTALYRGAIDTRFIIAPHDLDTTLGFSKNNVNQNIIHRRNNTYTNLSNLITHPALYPLLYGHIEELLATTFNPENMNPLIDRVYGTGDGDWLATVEINSSKQFVVDRAAAIRAEISRDAIVPVSPNNLIDLPEEFRHLADHQQSLRISEIMFNADGGDEFEYIELVNMAPAGSEPLDLRGVHFTNGVLFGFVENSPIPSSAPNASVLTLAPGERTLVVSNREAFLDRYDPDRTNLDLQGRIAGEFASGSLSDSGERIRLEGRLGEPILDFRFNDSWFSRTDGQGFSLVLRNDVDAQTPRDAWGDKSTWRSSQFQGGAPGMRDGGLDPNSVVINEILTHTDASPLGDWIELHNTTADEIDISGWYLSDSGSDLRKFRIPSGTMLPGGGFTIFDQFSADGFGDISSGNPGAFGLSELGDTLRLIAADDALVRENIDALHVLDDGSIILSTTASAVLGAEGNTLSFGNGDLVHYDPVTSTATMFLSEAIFSRVSETDSTVSRGNENIDALFVDERDGSVIFSTAGPATLLVPQPVGDPTPLVFDDGDLIRITPGPGTNLAAGQLGLATVTRVFSEDLFEVNLGETFARENIDALFVRDNGAFVISTTGLATIGGLLVDDGDLFEITPGATSNLAAGVLGNATVRRLVSEAIFAPKLGSLVPTENIDAAHLTFDGNDIASLVLSTVGTATLVGLDAPLRFGPLRFANADLLEVTPGTAADLANGILGARAEAQLIFEEDPADGSTTFFGDVAGYRDTAQFGAAEREVTFGLHVTSDGTSDLVAQSSSTRGGPNAPPKVGPVIVNEIMYNPESGLDGDEYIELRNISEDFVRLYDPLFQANTWKITGGVDFVFPTRITLRPGQLVLVTPIDPELFLENHPSVPSGALVAGPFTGRLDNAGDTVRLRKPGDPDGFGQFPMILVEEVSYDNVAPWPLQADGLGTALRRLQIDQYGNDSINWTDSVPGGTPGDLPISPRVEAVILSGTQWSPAFLNHVSDEDLGIEGFSLPTGASQFTTIPWTGVDVVRVQFSEDVTVEEDDLMLLGVNTTAHSFADFTYDPVQFLATWTLAGTLRADRVLLQLSDAIVDSVNLKLDGNWSNGTDQFPSGNGSIDPNDDFGFRIDVLPGDVGDSRRVDRGDLLAIVSRLSVDVNSLRYDPRRDLNGDGRIDLDDLRAALRRLSIRLPSGEPTASGGPSGVVAVNAVDTVFHRSGFGAAHAVAGTDRSPQTDTARRATGSTVAARRDATTRRTHLRSPLNRLQAFAVDHAMQDIPDHLSRAARSGRRRL